MALVSNVPMTNVFTLIMYKIKVSSNSKGRDE